MRSAPTFAEVEAKALETFPGIFAENTTPAPLLPNKREQEKARLLSIITSPDESTVCRALAGEELFALGRLVELDYQVEKLGLNGSPDVRRQAGG
jgi:hypothetical protein